MPEPAELARLAQRIETDEDFAMRVGEDPRAALEGEGLSDAAVVQVLARAWAADGADGPQADVVGIAVPEEDPEDAVSRITAAIRALAGSPVPDPRDP